MSQSFNKIGYKSAIMRGDPIPCCGLLIYPIKMYHYEEFLNCKDALILRQATLPVKYLSKDFLSAVFAFEYDSIKEEKNGGGFFQKLLYLLQLSLRIKDGENGLVESVFYHQNGNFPQLECLRVMQDGKEVSITPRDFSSRIRPLIADINGLELPNEMDNLDLVRDAELKKQFYARKQNLDVNIIDLIASVAYQSQCRERDVLEWTVREFEARKKAIERGNRYLMYGQAEMSGMVTFKNGNPVPSWCYDLIDDSLGTQSLSSLNFLENAAQK